MKIGILTYHRSHNFGAVLQAFALKTYLETLGNDVAIVDYFPHYHSQMYELVPWSYFKTWGLKTKVRFLMDLPFIYKRKQQRRDLFESFIKNQLNPIPIKEDQKYDVVVYGSDQIWRYQDTPIYKGYNDAYFGADIVAADRRVTYAASMGNIDKFDSHIDFFKKVFKNFDAMGIRETDLLEKVQPLYANNVSSTLDPVFLLSKKYWESQVPARIETEKYVLLYNLLGDAKLKRVAEELSSSKGLKLIEITGSIKKKKEKGNVKTIVGPLEFLSWIYNAEHIVTSSFHGVAFSIVFQKSFLTYLPRNSGRVRSLLASLDIEYLFLSGENVKDVNTDIDYVNVQNRLDAMIDKSKNFIDKNVMLRDILDKS